MVAAGPAPAWRASGGSAPAGRGAVPRPPEGFRAPPQGVLEGVAGGAGDRAGRLRATAAGKTTLLGRPRQTSCAAEERGDVGWCSAFADRRSRLLHSRPLL